MRSFHIRACTIPDSAAEHILKFRYPTPRNIKFIRISCDSSTSRSFSLISPSYRHANRTDSASNFYQFRTPSAKPRSIETVIEMLIDVHLVKASNRTHLTLKKQKVTIGSRLRNRRSVLIRIWLMKAWSQ